MSEEQKQLSSAELRKEAQKGYEELPLTLQIMHELKMSAQRWFIIAIAELVVILLILFFVFVVPTETSTTYTQDVDQVDGTTITQSMGE